MAKNSLIVSTMLILLSSLLTPSTISSQPPVITDTLYVGDVAWGPRRADPVRAYDTASGRLIFNVYDRLISMGAPVINMFGTWEVHEQYWEFSPSLATNVPTREEITKTVTSTEVNLTNPSGSAWSDGSACIGWYDRNATEELDAHDILYMMESDGSYRTWLVQSFDAGPPVSVTLWRGQYVFNIRTEPVVNFFDETGQVVDTFDVYDAEYSFKRGLVQDQSGSPMWMYYMPLFGQMSSSFWDTGNATDAVNLAHLIDNAVEVSGNDLIINVGMIFPDTAFKQILSQQWGSIVSKQFSLSIGCWDGDLLTLNATTSYPLWWTQWRRISRSPYDTSGNFRWAGTGPYRVSVFDQTNNIVKLARNIGYWRGWPAPGIKSFLETIEIRYIADWTTRKAQFLSCDLDICAVPRVSINELLDENGEPIDPKIKTIKNLSPTLVMDAAFFTFNIDPTSGYVGSGHFPDGIPLDFFNNTHVRKAFAYGFNHTEYLETVYLGEAICRETPLIHGLYPDYYTKAPDPPYTYDENYEMAEQELQNAIFNGVSVWDSGFYCEILYNEGSTYRQTVCEMLSDFFSALSTYNGRTGPPFTVVPVLHYPWWPEEPTVWPMWFIGWMADFPDADNWVRPFMHSHGDFSYFQNYTVENGWTTPGPRTGLDKDALIELALNTPDTDPNRAIYYADLDDIYIMDCPGFPIAQSLGRRWQKYWVKGWYYNPMYPSDYYYHLYKEDTCWFDISGSTPGQSDGVCNARDLTWLILHFNAKPPAPGFDDPKWVGTYGWGGVDPYGDRICNARDVTWAILHFNHANKP